MEKGKSMRSIKILIVTHKDFDAPTSDIYLPVCVGAGRDALKYKFQTNASQKKIRFYYLYPLSLLRQKLPHKKQS